MRAVQHRPRILSDAPTVCFAHNMVRKTQNVRRSRLILHKTERVDDIEVVRVLVTTIRDMNITEALNKTKQANAEGTVTLRTYYSPVAHDYCASICEKGLVASVEEGDR